MTTNNNNNNNITAAISTKDSESQASCPAECCMCGDYGVSNELFHCKVCQFRSQHRYCSNLYPKAESYQVCNWCLSQRDEKADKSQNSSNSSSSNKINGSVQEEDGSKNVKNKKKNNDDSTNNSSNNRVVAMKSQRSINLKLQQLNDKPIKQKRSPARSPTPPTPPTRKRIITYGALEEKKLIKRKKSEEISKNNNNNNNNTVTTIRRPYFRNKVRRYKLLDEVSC